VGEELAPEADLSKPHQDKNTVEETAAINAAREMLSIKD
jgi:hypothetical protein